MIAVLLLRMAYNKSSVMLGLLKRTKKVRKRSTASLPTVRIMYELQENLAPWMTLSGGRVEIVTSPFFLPLEIL